MMVMAGLLTGLTRLLVGAYPRWVGCGPAPVQRIYFANHSSHLDTIALWSALPPELRLRTRPVAARDYWDQNRLRRYVARQVLNVVFVDRTGTRAESDPLEPLREALAHGDSLIIFPEGTRRAEALPGLFKSGLYHLARQFPEVELTPVYLENLHRSLPKGTLLPVPLICTVRFGAIFNRVPGETKSAFLERARQAVVELAS